MNLLRTLFIALLLLGAGCSTRRQVPIGEVPEQRFVSEADELFGHDVLSQLMDKYPLDREDARISRVRNIVDKLTEAARAEGNPWHVYVLKDDSVQNAAATRGNYIFVWTGMLNVIQSDSELAATLAHEIGHVLAGHTKPTPQEEAQEAMAGIAGSVAREVVYSQGGAVGMAADLAGYFMQEAIKALIVNPEERRKELEADQIGLFLMADAKYDPEEAVEFWERVKNHPGFAGFPVQFLSTHPSSTDRIEELRKILPMAEARYQETLKGAKAKDWSLNSAHPQAPPGPARPTAPRPSHPASRLGDHGEDQQPRPHRDPDSWAIGK